MRMIYFMRFGNVVKIGQSGDPDARRSALQIAVAEDLRIIRLLAGDSADEKRIHRQLAHLHIRQELFRFADELLTRDFGLPDLSIADFEFIAPWVIAGEDPAARAEQGKLDRFAYRINEACAALGVSRNTIYRMIADGRLIARKLGRRTVVLPEDLRRAVRNLPAGSWNE